jgi:hypothetical protein
MGVAGVAFFDIPKANLGDFEGRLDVVQVFGGHLADLLGVACRGFWAAPRSSNR